MEEPQPSNFDSASTASDAALEREAFSEKLFAAERRLTGVRLVVIATNTAIYSWWMDKSGSVPWLAYSVIGLAWVYALYEFLWEPYRRYRVLLSAYFTSVSDTVLIIIWLYATGGFRSPFYVLLYMSVVAVAFRYPTRQTLIAALIYAGSYTAMVVGLNSVEGHTTDLLVRVSYVFISAILGAVISREMLAQTAQRVKVQVQLAAEERIRRSESQLAEAQRIAHLGSWEWNVESRKVIYSEEMYRIHDLQPDQPLTSPRRFLARVHPDDRHQTIEHLRYAYRSQEPFNFEHRIRLADGETRILQTRGRFLIDGSGGRMVGTTQDVTERLRAEQLRHRLMEEKATAQEAVGARDEFLSVVSHEVRSPLTSLSLHVQALMARSKSSQGLPSEVLATKLDTIDHQVKRLIRLANNLLDLSRITLGRLELERELLNLADLAREAVARNNESIARPGSAVMLTGDDPVVGFWDRLRLEQVLDNLLSNAAKYGGGKPIEIDIRRQGGEARLAIRDHGLGIPREHQTRIFQKFERAVSMRQSGGLGLGLWIVRQVVSALGGRVSVSSDPGEGSTFVVALPLHATSQQAALQGKTG